MSIVDKLIVLKLNAGWSPVGFCSVKKALIDMNSMSREDANASMALNFEYEKDEHGEWDLENPVSMSPVSWEEWISLPVREFDLAVHTAKRAIRVPTVLIAVNFVKMPMKHFRPNKNSIRERDHDICQVSGRKLRRGEGNVDHILPKSRGGKDTWDNLIYMDKTLNFKKGDKTLSEMGWGLIRVPKAPLPKPASALITEARHFTWNKFLINKQ